MTPHSNYTQQGEERGEEEPSPDRPLRRIAPTATQHPVPTTRVEFTPLKRTPTWPQLQEHPHNISRRSN
uniref:Uncharacterized protein n=1 Tax=Leersia perrieri TaxID=77586 RepID=A0A0D9X3J9_9ORYZ